MKAYENRELINGISGFNAICNRRLGSDSKSEIESLTSDLSVTIDRITWLMSGDYGSEYHYLAKHWLSDMPATEYRNNQAFKRIGVNLFTLVACLDYSDINPRLITKQLKANNVDLDLLNQQIVGEIRNYLIEH